MATQQAVIKKFMKALDTHKLKQGKNETEAALAKRIIDYAIKQCSNFNGVQDVIDNMLSDYQSSGGEKFLLEKCGINLDNRDTGAITGSDAGGSKIKTATNVVPNGTFDDSFDETSFTKRGVKFQLAYQDDKSIPYPSNPYLLKNCNLLKAEELHVWQGLYSFWAEESLKLIEESYGYSLTDSDAKFNQIRVFFVDDSSESRYTAKSFSKIYENSAGNYVYLAINMHYFKHIDQNNLDGKYPYWEDYYLDRLIAHELTHTVMNAKVDYFSPLPAIIVEGLAELTCGIDDSQDANIKKAIADKSMLEKLLILQEDYNEVDGINNADYVAGYLLLRYLAKQASTRGKNLFNDTKNQSVIGSAYEDTLGNSAANVTISGGKSNDSLTNFGGAKNKIYGDDGADTIHSYGNKVTIDTGADDDYVYLYSDASNAVLKGGSGNDELHSAAQTASIDAGTGNDYIIIYNNATKNTVNAGTGNDTIYTGAQTASINGGSGNDFIDLYTAAANTTILGGAGNDSIVSYSKNGVVYVHNKNDGKDTITGITAKDTLSLSGNNFSSTTSGTNVIIKNDKGSVKINDGKNVAFKIVIAGTSANDSVNNSISGATVSLLGGNDTVYNDAGNVKIYTGAGEDSIFNRSSAVTIRGGADNDVIENRQRKVKIYGDDGNDSILNTSSFVTIDAGKGDDSIENHSASDSATIHGGAGKDTIKINGSNALVYGDAGNDWISLKSYAQNATIYGGAGNDSVYGNNGNDKLYGEKNNDILRGGAGNDSLWGGEGNDSLWGGDGKDTFIYTANEGTDKIFDYATGDMLKILTADGSNGSFKSSNYSGGDLTLTINGGGKIIFDDVSASTKFNINGTTYKISGSKLK